MLTDISNQKEGAKEISTKQSTAISLLSKHHRHFIISLNIER